MGRPRTVGMRGPATAPNLHQGFATVLLLLLLLLTSEVAARREGRILSNPFGLLGHTACSSDESGDGQAVGQCYNEVECLAMGGSVAGYCQQQWNEPFSQGVCCVVTSSERSGRTSAGVSYFQNPDWPSSGNGSEVFIHTIQPLPDTCFVRFDLLTLELDVMGDNCVHDRLTVMGGKEPSGSMCGERSGEVTLIEVTSGKEIRLMVEVQSSRWRWNIGITQISCAQVEEQRMKMSGRTDCGKKNPSTRNAIGAIGETTGKRKVQKPSDIPGLRRKKAKKSSRSARTPKRKSAKKVFKQLEKLPKLSEFEKSQLKIYKPSFSKQELNYDKFNFGPLGRMRSQLNWIQKGRILYGNETDVNEYPWQVSMWIDRSHFCGGTLISDEWIATAAHCVDLQYRRHFDRITVSLGDHNVQVYDDTKNVFRKLKRIVRSPQYDNNFINGDMALLQLEKKVTFSDTIRPACLPDDPSTTFAYESGIISGWGYTETTKILKPRPLTSDVLREAEIYILPQDLCIEFSPFPITDRMVCTFKGPLGVESTCQGDSGGPLVVNTAENRHVLVGATSFGVSTCEGPYPAMFTRITAHLSFIHAAMVPAPMEYMMEYETPSDPSAFPAFGSTAIFDIF